jgi:hypothetical protein
MSANFIPDADSTFDGWQFVFMSNLASRAPAWNVPLDEVAALQTLQTRWKTAYAAASDPGTRTKGAVKEKQEARDAYEKALRRMIRTYITYNPNISDKQREDMGLPVHKTSRTPAPVATDPPVVSASDAGPRRVRFDFGAEKGSAAKPAGQHGTEIASVIADSKPEEIDDLVHSSFDTHTPLFLTFKESERGKTLWFAARWENTRGEKGPWGNIQGIVIP